MKAVAGRNAGGCAVERQFARTVCDRLQSASIAIDPDVKYRVPVARRASIRYHLR